MIRDEATNTQIKAARPEKSTWLEANAGSGKTRVLTDRVARLLLEGVEPQHILCLTYTKAAASEMQNRLFKRLGEWAMKDPDELRKALSGLGVEAEITPEFLKKSRRLFAQAIEAPGGLKIQTIHSFCSSLLRRFPLEAGVSPQFTEMEERTASLLRREIIDEMALGEDRALVDSLAHHYTGEDFDALTSEILRYRDYFSEDFTHDDCKSWLGVKQDVSRDTIVKSVFLGGEKELLNQIVPRLLQSGKQDNTAGERLRGLGQPSFEALEIFEAVFLTGKGAKEPFTAKIDKFPTKAVREELPDEIEHLNRLMLRVESTRQTRLAYLATEKTLALHQFAGLFLKQYDEAKQSKGWLDFDDLIRRARTLLTDPAVAQWVLFRLDGGIDHILVDEAQDTSPVQWDVIERLAQEFTSGQGARANVTRTLFVVGDKKQSIYSFQGADPRAFDRMREDFSQRLDDIGTPLQKMEMMFSFRSSPAVLKAVDAVFHEELSSGIGQPSNHLAFKSAMPGRVDLWPLVPRSQETDDTDWTAPVDLPAENHHTVVLARAIAEEIDRLISSGATIPEEHENTGTYYRRPVRAGDFMILVRGRKTGLFHQIIQACKELSLPIAGADRLKVGAELAVRDIAALLSFIDLPDDNLSLANALKSPLFGFSEQDLFSLSYNRGNKSLWEALKDQEDKHSHTLEVLADLRNRSDFLRPYELIERILTRHKGREKLLGRLGLEAEDGIDALLGQAMAYEQNHVPSLTGFLVWMQTDNLEIKRQMSSGDLIRVMTVHGAKGLESPIVILPDTTPPQSNLKAELLPSDGKIFWKTRSDAMPDMMEAAKVTAQGRQRDEYLRLLYVAMTRAEKWLIVAGTEKAPASKSSSGWYDLVNAGFEALEVEKMDSRLGPARRFAQGDWDGLELISEKPQKADTVGLPEWTSQTVTAPDTPPEAINPSKFEGPKALASEVGMDEEAAKAFGSAVHYLLEHLPNADPNELEQTADGLLGNASFNLPDHLIAAAKAQAIQTLSNSDLAVLFGDGSYSEVPFSADLNGRHLKGIIDRLVVEGDTVTAVDFKTNREIPNRAEEVPLGVLQQMGAYAHALRQIYPDKVIRTAILWTARGKLMPLSEELTSTALAEAVVA